MVECKGMGYGLVVWNGSGKGMRYGIVVWNGDMGMWDGGMQWWYGIVIWKGGMGMCCGKVVRNGGMK